MAEKQFEKITMAERMVHGNFTLDEVQTLKMLGKSAVYADIYTGKLAVEKHGRRTLVPGPLVKLYLDNQPMPADATEYVSAVRNGNPPASYEPARLRHLPPRKKRTVAKKVA